MTEMNQTPSRHGSRWIRKLVWASGMLLLLGLAIPLLTLNFWRQGIAKALSEGLGRPVRFGAVHVQLLDGPGFSIDNVVVEEDPRFGIEPFARMESLEARIALRSIWERPFRFSTLVFVRPSLNVVRTPDGQLNVESLGASSTSSASSVSFASSASSASSSSPQPVIRVESGRINFKSGQQKHVYIIDELDLDLTPPASPTQSWALRFEATPRRTDSLLRPVSRIRGQGEFGATSFRPQSEPGVPLRLDLSAEDALLEDLLRLLVGTDYGIHGVLDFRMRLAGTTSLLRVSGTTSLTDLHRWDMLSAPGVPALRGEIKGFVDLASDSLELTSFEVPLSPGSVTVEGRIARLFHDPQPELRARLDGLSLAALVEVARSFTDRLPAAFEGDGTLDGELRMAGGLASLAGDLRVSNAVFEEPRTRAALRFSDFSVALHGETGSLGPVRVRWGEEGDLGASFQWDRGRQTSRLHLDARMLPILSLLEWLGKDGEVFGGVERVEGAVRLSQGTLSARADLTLAAGKPPRLQGWAEVTDAAVTLAAAAEPLRIVSARLVFQQDRVLIHPFSAALGNINLHGSLRTGPAIGAGSVSDRAIRALSDRANASVSESLRENWPEIEFDLQASEVDLAELERLFPERDRFLSYFRFLGRRDTGPSVWDHVVARGTVRAEALGYGDRAIRNLKASVDLRDRVLEVRRFTGTLAGGAQSGQATIRWGSDPPSFRVETRFERLNLHELAAWAGFPTQSLSGKLSGTVRLVGSGRDRDEIVERMGGSGRFTGQQVTLSGPGSIQTKGPWEESLGRGAALSAAFQIARKEVVLTEVLLVPPAPTPATESAGEGLVEPSAWRITGTVGLDQTLDLRIQESAGAEYRWSGSLAESRVTAVRPEPEGAFRAAVPPK